MTMQNYLGNDIEFDFGPTIKRYKDRKHFSDIFFQKFPGNSNLIYLTSKGLEEFKKIVDPERYLYKSRSGSVVYTPIKLKTFRYKELYYQEELEEFFNEMKDHLIRMRMRIHSIKDSEYEYFFDMDEPFSLYIEKFDESFPIRINMNIRKEKPKKDPILIC